MTMTTMKLIRVNSAEPIPDEPGAYTCDIRCVGDDGIEDDVLFVYRPDDPYGLGPAVGEALQREGVIE